MDSFLSANSADGFFSFFDTLLEDTDKRVYLIKGGPGCGKSTLMKKVCEKAQEKGEDFERIFCSSDTNSLDGVYLPEQKILLLDATPPHAFEPKYPGAVEQTVQLGAFWEDKILKAHKTEIIALGGKISTLFVRIYHLTGAAGKLYRFSDSLVAPAFSESAAAKSIQKYLSALAAVKQNEKGLVSHRFFSALSPVGIAALPLPETGHTLKVEGAGSALYLALFARRLQALGYAHTLGHSPLLPDKIEAIYVPALSLKVLTGALYPDTEGRELHTRRFLNSETLGGVRNKLTLVKKLSADMLAAAGALLLQEKELHDRLEQYYMEAMDYVKLNNFTENFVQNLF